MGIIPSMSIPSGVYSSLITTPSVLILPDCAPELNGISTFARLLVYGRAFSISIRSLSSPYSGERI